MSLTFYRDQIRSRQAKAFYDAICADITGGNVSGIYRLTATNPSAAARDGAAALLALRKDRPEYFFILGNPIAHIQGSQVTLEDEMLYTPRQIAKIRSHLDRALAAYTVYTFGLPVWEREKLVYERIAKSLTYIDHGDGKNHKDYDHNIVGPLLQGSGVCEGFSCLLMLALRKIGIPCIRVSGQSKNEAHCWNLAWIDGSPVHLDITWDKPNENGDLGFFYFNLTDEQITRDHRITTKGLPQCMDPTHGYHYRRGTVFSDTEKAAGYLRRALGSNAGPVSIRFSNSDAVTVSVRKAMRNVPVGGYKYQYCETQRTAMIWTV